MRSQGLHFYCIQYTKLAASERATPTDIFETSGPNRALISRPGPRVDIVGTTATELCHNGKCNYKCKFRTFLVVHGVSHAFLFHQLLLGQQDVRTEARQRQY
eukprot:jgi/Psemu1/2697/gm1.2697_g